MTHSLQSLLFSFKSKITNLLRIHRCLGSRRQQVRVVPVELSSEKDPFSSLLGLK